MIEAAVFQNQLLNWFDAHGRKDLPWQREKAPYPVWISEIMLQQTQVNAVIPFFNRFMRSFPTLNALAEAPLESVIEHWAGLGYYARARNLHASANILLADYQGQFPQTVQELQKLPGVGRSTAGAILSLGMGISAPILDGNVKRVLARQIHLEEWPGTPSSQKSLWTLADQLTPQGRSGDFNQAMMDLGALLCTRRNPDCTHCPVASSCKALENGTVDRIPTAKPRTFKPQRSCFLLVLRDAQDRLYLERRPTQGIWGGLLSLPEFDNLDQVKDYLDTFNQEPLPIEGGPPIQHTLTHFTLILTPVFVRLQGEPSALPRETAGWYAPHSVKGVPAPISKIIGQPVPSTSIDSGEL